MPDTDVVSMIQSAEEFLAALKVGAAFFYMSSRNFRPYTIEGPFTILGFAKRGKAESLNVKCRIRRGQVWQIEYHAVNDLTNQHHAIFTDQEAASTYLKERQEAFDAAVKASKNR